MKNVLPNCEVVQLAPAAARTATFATTLMDCGKGNATVAALIHVGTDTGTLDGTNFFTPTFEESDTTVDGDFAAVAAGNILRSFPVLNSKATYENKTVAGECRPTKRYVRVKLTETETCNVIIGATGIIGALRSAPATYTANIIGTGTAST